MSPSNGRRPHQCQKLCTGGSHEFRIGFDHRRRPIVRYMADLHEFEPAKRHEFGCGLHRNLLLYRYAGCRVQRHLNERISTGVRTRCWNYSGHRPAHIQPRACDNPTARFEPTLCGAAHSAARSFGSSLPDRERQHACDEDRRGCIRHRSGRSCELADGQVAQVATTIAVAALSYCRGFGKVTWPTYHSRRPPHKTTHIDGLFLVIFFSSSIISSRLNSNYIVCVFFAILRPIDFTEKYAYPEQIVEKSIT